MGKAKKRGSTVTRYDWISLAILLVLFTVWILTGCRYAWLRHLIIGLTFFYILVIRVLVNYNRLGKDE